MQRTRRAFLKSVVIAPVITGAWVVYESQNGRLKIRQSPVACYVPNGTPGQSCGHPTKPIEKPKGVAW